MAIVAGIYTGCILHLIYYLPLQGQTNSNLLHRQLCMQSKFRRQISAMAGIDISLNIFLQIIYSRRSLLRTSAEKMQAANNPLNHTAACHLPGILCYIADTGMRAACYYVYTILLLVDQRRIIQHIIIMPAVSQAMLSHRLFIFKIIYSL